MWSAKIIVEYKAGILDPEAKTIQRAFDNLGYNDISKIETGRYFKLNFKESFNKDEVEKHVIEVCDKLLSNPVIENYSYELEEVSKWKK